MNPRNSLKMISASALLLTLSACASIPRDFEQVASHSWQQPEQTPLGTFFDEYAPADRSLTGVRLLGHPREAFRARFGFAALAEKTLDLQYYLWKGDLTGQLLLFRALEAADRGVHVRILIDDIYHSGRDNNYAAIDSHPNMEVRVYNPMGNRGAGRGANLVYHKGTLDHRMHNKIFLVDSEEFAATVLEAMEADFDPANSYRVTLDEKGNLVWTAEGPDGPMVWHKEPGTTAWQRFKLRFMSWIPMEKEL